MTMPSRDLDELADTSGRPRESGAKLIWVCISATLLLTACSGSEEPDATAAGEATASGETRPSEEATATEEAASTPSGEAASGPIPLDSIGADVRGADGFLQQLVQLPPGTYRTDGYPDPLTVTTTAELTLFQRGLTASPEVGGQELQQVLIVGQPRQVVDLSQTLTPGDVPDGPVVVPTGHLIDVPENPATWIGEAEAIRVVREGSTTVDGMPTPWWDVEVVDNDSACSSPGSPEACQSLWPDGEDGGGVVAMAFEGTESRVWAVPGPEVTTLAMAQAFSAEGGDAPSWLDEAGAIVESMTFE